ncbi:MULTISPECIES: phage major capsid protein [unclassified Streptomyces]|uniref:phage major capsid protein n=1 Tax=unclassified Streptomyces TaxID=2593676 RepID=UPI00247434C4|nr:MULTISPECIES: phage major capsid protein [unclassified Streptomyces]MDH6449425.1 HK97 family phage major capsid protein [Streptomyces sp. SAI-119]MDH6499993.1 HK97 family phage major capsid protein [Streptomyces sp. SAI-149]
MARNDVDAWIPEENDSEVVTRVLNNSAVELLAKRKVMGSDTIKVPRMGALSVDVIAKGADYTDGEPTNDNVILETRKFGKTVTLAEEDLDDTLADVIAGYQEEWAVSYARKLDNAALACTGTENGGTVPFTSLYKGAGSGQKLKSAGAVTYTHLSDTFGIYEAGDFANDADTVVIAHPYFKSVFRGIKDDNGMPIFVEGTAGTPATLFQVPVTWSYGLKLSATATDSPTGSIGAVGTAGNPLLVVGNRQHLLLGVRSGPESMIGDEFRSDEKILKMRARRGFGVSRTTAFGILEVTNA